jgi:2-polyprenyl-3-methyl-5-hydroxy-6-metoxy-1,4-benzoquinol methylase
VAGCCAPTEYRRFFSRKVAAKDARRYRKRGLTGTAQRLTELAGDVTGASVLDVGGGVGAIELELLEAGAERATSVEISAGYEDEAETLLAERRLGGRVDRRVADFVADAATIDTHDVVILHRVVCCYPDVDALVGAAAAHTGRILLLTYPQERWYTRAGLRVVNAFLRLSHCGFRTYVHPVERIFAAAALHGLAPNVRERNGVLWESASLGRAGS